MPITSSSKPTPGEQEALNQIANAGGGSAGGGMVYMGQVSQLYGKNEDYLSGAAVASLSKRKQDLVVPMDEAMKEYYSWNQKKQQDFIAQLILAGRLKLGDGMAEGATEWEKLVKLSAKYTAAGNKVSPFDILATYVKASGGANAWRSVGAFEVNTQTGERRYVGPGTYLGNGKAQQTDTRVNLTDPDTAKAVATKLFQDMMGRDPGAGELTAFATALHSAEQNNPVVATTTTQYDMETGQPISSATTSSGGLDAAGKQYIGEQQIKGKKEYGALQAATTLQNAFDALVFGGPGA